MSTAASKMELCSTPRDDVSVFNDIYGASATPWNAQGDRCEHPLEHHKLITHRSKIHGVYQIYSH